MMFRPKNIFLADDDNNFRPKLRAVLEGKGHNVVIEAVNGKEARQSVQLARELGVEVAVLDCHMPNREDGPEIAGMLNAEIPNLLVVSVSDQWGGVWLDPNFNRECPHPKSPYGNYDINGREEYKGPDYYVNRVGWDLVQLSEQIGELEFNIRDVRTLEGLEMDFSSARRK